MNLYAGKEWGCRYRKWTCGHSRGGREWDRWKSSTNMYKPSRIKWIAGEKLLYNTGVQSDVV